MYTALCSFAYLLLQLLRRIVQTPQLTNTVCGEMDNIFLFKKKKEKKRKKQLDPSQVLSVVSWWMPEDKNVTTRPNSSRP